MHQLFKKFAELQVSFRRLDLWVAPSSPDVYSVFKKTRVPMIFTFFLLRLFLVVHIYLQQSDEHSKQDAKKLQIGAGLSHLATDKEKVMLP